MSKYFLFRLKISAKSRINVVASLLFLGLLFLFLQANAQVKSLYGVTYSGGQYGSGTIFHIDTTANNLTVVYDFKRNIGHPKYAQTLCKANNGNYYGIATVDLATHKYVIYEYNPLLESYKLRKHFSNDIPNSSLVLHPNGYMYFTTKATSGYNVNGRMMRYNLVNNDLQIFFPFGGNIGKDPKGDLLITSKGMIYGTTTQGGTHYVGTIYKLNVMGGYPNISVVANLMQLTTGYQSLGGLVEGANGKLYGLCNLGGVNGKGTLFELDTLTGLIAKKIDLNTQATGIEPETKMTLANNGKLYGVCSAGGVYNNGVLFSYNPTSGIFTKVLDFNSSNISLGNTPLSNLFLASNGKLYGTCKEGGSNNKGILFELNPLTNSFSKKKDFHSINTGANPYGGHVENNGVLTGICEKGGVVSGVYANRGTIYSYNLNNNVITKDIVFEESEGSGATSGLTLAPNGKMYGTTKTGNQYEFGVLYEFDPQNSQFKKLYEFNGPQGKYPQGKLVITSNNIIYGITSFGGNYNKGTIFKYDLSTSTFSKIIDFNGTNGYLPKECPIVGPSGILYGITSYGGTNNKGVIYSLNPQSGIFTKIASLNTINTHSSYSGLYLASNGKMYATAQAPSPGGIFEFNPQTGSVSTKYIFSSNEGKLSQCVFIEGAGHKLYGSTKDGGVNNLGTVFEYNIDSNTFTLLTSFTGFVSSGSDPTGGLFLSNNKLYGMNSDGGSYSKGTIFEYDLQQHTLTIKKVLTPASGGDPINVQFLEYTCNNSYDTINAVSCNQYIGKSLKVYTSSGVFFDTSFNACSAFQIDMLNLTIINNDTTVIHQATSLHANQVNATYQWLYCDSAYKAISGGVLQNYTPVINGNYAVVVTQGLCSDTSSCHSFLNVGLTNKFTNEYAVVYPNPANQYLFLQFDKEIIRTIRMRDIYGKELFKIRSRDLVLRINSSSYAPGVYLIEVSNDKGSLFVKKIIIQ